MPRKPSKVRIEADWESAVGRALKKTRPAGGWPKKPVKPRKKKVKRRK